MVPAHPAQASSVRPDAWRGAARWLAVLGLATVSGAAALWMWRSHVEAEAERPRNTLTATATAARPAAARQSAPGRALADLGGTTLDAARLFELGFAGGLVIDPQTRTALEILMADMGDPPTPQDLQRIEDALRKGLPAREAEQAIRLVRDYRAYVNEMEQQIAPRGIPATVQEMNALFDDMAAVRQRHFDAGTADALFGAHEVYARYAMEASLIEQDESLSGPARQEQLDRLREQLPEAAKALLPALTPAETQLEQQIAQARRNGATETQVEAMRQQAGVPARN